MRLILSTHPLKAQNFPSRKDEGTKTKRKLAAAKMIAPEDECQTGAYRQSWSPP